MSNRGVDIAKALYEQDESDCEVRDRLVAEGLSVRSAATAMWRARRLLKRPRDGSIKTGHGRAMGVDWRYVDEVVLPAEAEFLASLRTHERPPAIVSVAERSVSLWIGAFVD